MSAKQCNVVMYTGKMHALSNAISMTTKQEDEKFMTVHPGVDLKNDSELGGTFSL